MNIQQSLKSVHILLNVMNIQRVSRKCLKIFCGMHLNRNGHSLQCQSKILSVKKYLVLSSAWTSMHKCVPERRLRGILNYKWRGGPSLYFVFLFSSVSRTKKTDVRPFKDAFVFVLPGFCYQSRQLRSENH